MKAEEIKNKTNEAVAYLVEALQSGQSEVLIEYLNAMARFYNYSFGNIVLIARQRPGNSACRNPHLEFAWPLNQARRKRGILFLAPMVARRARRKKEISTEIENNNRTLVAKSFVTNNL